MNGSDGDEHHQLHGVLQWCDVFFINPLTLPATARTRNTFLGNYYPPSFFVTYSTCCAYDNVRNFLGD
jgi:hypothetical protein